MKKFDPVRDIYRGNCSCGKWMIVPITVELSDPIVCDCGIKYFCDGNERLLCCGGDGVLKEPSVQKKPERPSWDAVWMDLARALAKRSTCRRTSVGCVVVTLDNTRVLSIGYNGGAKGLSNGCLSDEPGKCGHLHAEINALLKCSYDPNEAKKIYTTSSPCYTCAVAIVNAGISEVVYDEEYRLREGVRLLLRAGVRVRHGEEVQVQVEEDR